MNILKIIFIVVVLLIQLCIGQNSSIRPVVLWHGLGDCSDNPLSMGRVKTMIEAQLPGIYVHSISIGNNAIEDTFNGYFKNINEQIDMVCKILKDDINLVNGFNAIGFSQGGQFLRGYVQRCNDPPVYNLISLGGQHQGVSSLPTCTALNGTICKLVDGMAEMGVYDKYVQDNLVPAGYFYDPFKYDEYLEKSDFIADINNLRETKNQTYKDNLLSLNKFVLGLFDNDTVVIPRESEQFGYFLPGQDDIIIPMEKSELYIEDWIGIQQLDNEGRLLKISSPGNHLQFTDQWFDDTIIPLLDN